MTARAVIGFLLYTLLVPALLFVAAGTVDWPLAWVYVALLLASTLGSRLIVLMRNPDTLRERARFTSSEDTPAWDRILVLVVGLLGPMVTMLIIGLDHRFGWSGLVPDWAQIVATLLVAGGYGLAVWAMIVNRYFSAVARVQKDRGQTVVRDGPYRYVRHPSYAGAIVASLALPVMLDALWALIPALGMSIAVIIRTRLEDLLLMRKLDGYRSYARETTYRLIPGIW